MQGNKKFSTRQLVPSQKKQVTISDMHGMSPAPIFSAGLTLGPKHSRPHGFQFEPSEICPKNFIVFDHTEDKSQIMIHPGIAHNFYPPDVHETPTTENVRRKFRNNVDLDVSSTFIEDSNDIDALLSLDYEDKSQEDSDEEVMSTARTQGCDGSSSPDSCSNYAPHGRTDCSYSNCKSSYGDNQSAEGKRKKVRKMVKVLQGMVPGGDQMNTVAVLDEAIKYLKSMKVEMQNVGIENLGNFP